MCLRIKQFCVASPRLLHFKELVPLRAFIEYSAFPDILLPRLVSAKFSVSLSQLRFLEPSFAALQTALSNSPFGTATPCSPYPFGLLRLPWPCGAPTGLIHDRDVFSRFSDEKWAPEKSCGGGGGGAIDGGVLYVHRKQNVCGPVPLNFQCWLSSWPVFNSYEHLHI